MGLSKEERYAALLDGRCTEEERRQLMAELAAGGEDLEVFAHVAAVLDEMEEEDRAAGVIPFRPHPMASERTQAPPKQPPKRVRILMIGGLLLAACLAALIVRPLLKRGPADGPAAVVAMLAEGDEPLPDSLLPSIEPQRGIGTQLGDPERVRLGAWLVTLEIAGRTDPGQARRAAGEIAKLLARTDDPDNLAGRYRAIAQGTRRFDPDLAAEAEAIAGGVKSIQFGEWLQGARIAATGRDVQFFRKEQSRRWLAGGELPESLRGAARSDLERARAAVSLPTPDWQSLARSLDAVLARMRG